MGNAPAQIKHQAMLKRKNLDFSLARDFKLRAPRSLQDSEMPRRQHLRGAGRLGMSLRCAKIFPASSS